MKLAFLAIVTIVPAAHAQFLGTPTITFDPTQAAHVIQQIAQAEKTYTTVFQETQTVISLYNLAAQMASSPQSLYSGYGSGLPRWVPIFPSTNAYGNSQPWITNVSTGIGDARAALGEASVAHIAQLTGYNTLQPQAQQAIAAQGATIDLGDAVSASNAQALGTIRSNQTQRLTDIANLETASHSLAPTDRTELATLQRINQALLLLLRTQQDGSQMAQTSNMQEILAAKQRLDELKIQFQVAQDYQSNFQSKSPIDNSADINRAFTY